MNVVSEYEKGQRKMTLKHLEIGKKMCIRDRSSYMVPEILSIPDEQLEAFQREKKELGLYGRLLSQLLKRKTHTLSDELEALLAASQEATQGGAQVFLSLIHI